MDEVTVKGLLGMGGMIAILVGPMAWFKVLDSYREWKARKVPTSRRLVSIDWLDPELRRN